MDTIVLSSITSANRGKKILDQHQIKANIIRSQALHSKFSCGYALVVREDSFNLAIDILKQNDIKVVMTY